jgi:hypothetical protein
MGRSWLIGTPAPRSLLYRFARYISRGAPAGSLLNGEWVRIDADLEAPPRFVKREAPDVHMLHTGSSWVIARGADPQQREVLAEAASTALHPTTAGTSAWRINLHGVFHPCSDFEVVCDGPNTEQVGPPLRFGMGHAALPRVLRRRPTVVWRRQEMALWSNRCRSGAHA